MIFGYTRFLERENDRLNKRIEVLERRNEDLIIHLIEKTPLTAKTAPVPVKHEMKKGKTSAECSCGWRTYSEDPVKLQNEITGHYRGNVIPASGRKSWTQQRNTLEKAAEE